MSTLVLITNDDGIDSEGLWVLYEKISEVFPTAVVAPINESSGSSHSISLTKAIRVESLGDNIFKVDGTPTDCTNIAINGLLKERPSLVIAGINKGGNFGDDIFYSGTTAAAMESALLGIPAISASLHLGKSRNFLLGAKYVRLLAENVLREGLPERVFINVNIPDIPNGEDVKGIKVTKLCRRVYGAPATSAEDPRGMKFWFIGGNELGFLKNGETDIEAVLENYISVTPIKVEMNHACEIGWITKLK